MVFFHLFDCVDCGYEFAFKFTNQFLLCCKLFIIVLILSDCDQNKVCCIFHFGVDLLSVLTMEAFYFFQLIVILLFVDQFSAKAMRANILIMCDPCIKHFSHCTI